jgi:DNA polymerase I-like protein with 3'-5' exonuclease and polymerase domains
MKKRGVRVDTVAIERLTAQVKKDLKEITDQLKYTYNITQDIIASPKKLTGAMALLGVRSPISTPTGGQSWSADALELIDHPVAPLILATKAKVSLLNKYLEGSMVNSIVNSRIHTTFSPNKRDTGGTITGRWASANPNLQNISARDEKHGQKTYGTEVRNCFIPDEGCTFAAFDYSAIEAVLLAHYAQGPQAEWFRQQIRDGADYHKVVMDMTGIANRDIIKRMNYGFIYGMGLNKLMSINVTLFKQLSMEAGMDMKAYGQQLYTTYHAKFPVIKDTMKWVEQQVRAWGYIDGIGGRRHHKPRPEVGYNGAYNIPYYKMTNYEIQGCQLPEARIHTTEGMLQFKELPAHPHAQVIIGNETFDFDWIDTGIKHCFELETTEHNKLALSDETPLVVLRAQGEVQIKMKDLQVGDVLPLDEVVSGGVAVGLFEPTKNAHNQNVFVINGNDPFIWYLAGYMLGDGGMYSSGIALSFNTIDDRDQLAYITAGLEQYNIHYKLVPHRYSANSVRVIFRSATLEQFYQTILDWDMSKTIPTKLFQLLPDARRQVIKAMMDSDGTNKHAISWVSAREQLAYDFIQLLASVGIHAKLDNYSQENCYRVFIRNQDTYMRTIGFLCGHKNNRRRQRINNKPLPVYVWQQVQPLFLSATLPKGFRKSSEATCLCNARNNRKQLGRDMCIRLLTVCNIPIPDILLHEWTKVVTIEDIGMCPTNDIHVHSNEHLYTSWLGVITHNSAAEILKQGMVTALEAGIFGDLDSAVDDEQILHAHLAVHDEVDTSIPLNKVAVEAAQELERCMVNAYKDKLSVPLKVSCEVGASWGASNKDEWRKLVDVYRS